VLDRGAPERGERTLPLEALRRRSWPPPAAHELGRDHLGWLDAARPTAVSSGNFAWQPVHREATKNAARQERSIWYALPLEPSDTIAMLTARHEPPLVREPVAQWRDEHVANGCASGSSVSVVNVGDVLADVEMERLPRNTRSVVQVTTWSAPA